MLLNKILSKNFLSSAFYKQNSWHKHGVVVHPLCTVYYAVRFGGKRFFLPALLHDIGKPFCATQKGMDRISSTFSFTKHEELSYLIIKGWPISQRTKDIVRYHFLIRDIEKNRHSKNTSRFNRLSRVWERLDESLKSDLLEFMQYNDMGKHCVRIKTTVFETVTRRGAARGGC